MAVPEASVPRLIVALGLLVLGGEAGCKRRAPSSPTRPPDPPLPPALVEAPAGDPLQLVSTPVALAPYEGGSSCNLVLREGALYWLMQDMAPPTGEPDRASGDPSPASAGGAVLDCTRTRGSIHRLSLRDGTEEVIARTDDWPWTLHSDDHALYWIGYCSHEVFTVPLAGGTPARIGRPGLHVIDVFPHDGHVLVADRFGPMAGVYRIDRTSGRTERVATRGHQPGLLGGVGAAVYWAEPRGETWTAHATRGADEREQVGTFDGMPMDMVAHGDALFVLTTQQVVRIEAEALSVLSTVPPYGDRGGLAVDGSHAYWANGRRGTLSRIEHDGGDARETHVGGEPCGVGVDRDHVYWLDRGRNQIMGASLAVFDAPVPPPSPDEPGPESLELELGGPPPGLTLEVHAKPIRVRERWAVDLQLHVRVHGPQPFTVGSKPAPHLSGEHTNADGSQSGFADGCSSDLAITDSRLGPGARKTFSRRYGTDPLETLDPGDAVELHVGLCHVGLPDGRWVDVPAATVVVRVPSNGGQPTVTVTPLAEQAG